MIQDATSLSIRRLRDYLGFRKQADFAGALKVSQPHISRLERGETALTERHQRRIRELAKERRKAWSDSWFFDPPPELQ